MSYRKNFLHAWLLIVAVVGLFGFITVSGAIAQPLPGGTLDPTTLPKYVMPLFIPPEMPTSATPSGFTGRYYEIAVRQFEQQILPAGFPMTTVWGYGSVTDPATFRYPAFTIESTVDEPVRVKWINDLIDKKGKFLRHILPVDQTLHWANPPGGIAGRDGQGTDPKPYKGPVPIITHLHGAHVNPDSDGFPEAWYLPAARNIPAGFSTRGSNFGQIPGAPDEAGAALFQYRNDQRATTLWFHDHTLGMTRTNVYAGPVGFYLLRGGASDLSSGLPGPSPKVGDPAGTQYHEIPIVIQDRSFNKDGSLFYPDNRAFFEGVKPSKLKINFIPKSDVSPIWNPEFFANTTVVNGRTWPFLEVEPRRYRFRFLNASNSRFLILKTVTDPLATRPAAAALPFWQIGADGGFLPAPVSLDQLLIGLSERADVIVDFTGLQAGTEIFLINEGPDEPFGGGIPGTDFASADPGTTGQVMKFVVVPLNSPDTSTSPDLLSLPPRVPLGGATNTRQVSLNEEESVEVCVGADPDTGEFLFPIKQIKKVLPGPTFADECAAAGGVPFGPTKAKLGTVDLTDPLNPAGIPKFWADLITEDPAFNSTEIWEIFNFTEDAHPIHIHMVQFEIVGREVMGGGTSIAGQNTPLPGETGTKDTVIAFPGEITRVKALYDIAGLFVWHCHILEHEDNEMMRPYCIGGGCTP